MFQSSLWEQAAASLSKTCKELDQGWFHPFSCPPSPVTSLVSFAEIKKKFWLHSVFTAQVFSISSEQELPCSCCAWVFHSSVFSCCTSQILGHTGSVIVAHWLNLPVASGVFPNQISNAYSKHPADRLLTTGLKGKSFWEGLRNQSLLHETWHYGLFLRRLIECCPLLQATSWDQDWFRFPSQVFLQHLEAVPAMWLCSYLSFWNPH